ADGPADGLRVAPDSGARLVEGGEPLAQDVVHAAEPGGVPGIGPGRGQVEHALALRSDEDRRLAVRWGQELGTLVVAPRAIELDPFAAEQPRRDLEILLEAPDAVIERVAEGLVLRFMPAATEAKDQAALGDLVELAGHLREQACVPERRAHDQDAELHPGHGRRERAERRPGLVEALFGLVG